LAVGGWQINWKLMILGQTPGSCHARKGKADSNCRSHPDRELRHILNS
jgi:hypothetical protein